MQFFIRKIYNELVGQVNTKPIVVLTGMRRSGKTTLFKKIYEDIKSDNKVFLDLDNVLNQQIFSEPDFNNIWKNLSEFNIHQNQKAYIFLDEIQAMPQAVKVAKYLYDHYNVKFFITGSSSFYLKNLFPESLAGRKIAFELYPLDFDEFLHFKQKTRKQYDKFEDKEKYKSAVRYELYQKYYDEYLNYGGFPQVVLEESQKQKKYLLKDIFSSYFQKDVQMLSDFSDIQSLQEMILLLMQRTGSKLNITRIASELSLSRPTIYSYLSFLEGTYFVSLVAPFSRNIDKEVSGARKVYICDNGFLTAFARIDEGNLLENIIFCNLRKYGKVNFYENRNGREVDFILPQIQTALEIKTTGTKQDYGLLKKKTSELKIKNHYIVTKKFLGEKGFIPAMEI